MSNCITKNDINAVLKEFEGNVPTDVEGPVRSTEDEDREIAEYEAMLEDRDLAAALVAQLRSQRRRLATP
jgi:hypothetical protein